MEENVILEYYNKILHLRGAKNFLNDIILINDVLINYTEEYAYSAVNYLATKYQKDIDKLGRLMTGIMVFDRANYPEKDEDDLMFDLMYLRDAIIVFAAVHVGLEKTLHTAVVKIQGQKA